MEREVTNFEALSAFFLDPSFARIAATTTKNVALPPAMLPCVPVMGQIRQEIAVIGASLACETLWTILESSERADRTVQTHFSRLTSITAASTLARGTSLYAQELE